jgi:hypothetical protein
LLLPNEYFGQAVNLTKPVYHKYLTSLSSIQMDYDPDQDLAETLEWRSENGPLFNQKGSLNNI